jgi:hypothetical protein
MLFISSCTVTGPSGPAGADTVTSEFQYGVLPGSGYTAANDAGINTWYPNFSSGADDVSFVGVDTYIRRTLFKFDISTIVPSNVKVKKAYIVLYSNLSTTPSSTVTITGYRVLKNWVEGAEAWHTNPDTYTSWLYYNGAGNAWDNPGGDYAVVPATGSENISGYGQFTKFELDAALVQSWISAPETNYGLIFIEADEAGAAHWIQFVTKEETADPHKRPRLIVNYSI